MVITLIKVFGMLALWAALIAAIASEGGERRGVRDDQQERTTD